MNRRLSSYSATLLSLLGVPMRIKDNVIGVLEALNKRSGPFTDEDRDTLAILASQAAVAIHNARLLDELRRAYEELGKLDQMKSAFIALASHELRTPLGVILGYATILHEDTEGQTGEHARALFNSAAHLRNLIESMTNLSYIETGRLALAAERLDLRDLLAAARDDVYLLAQGKEQALYLDTPVTPLPVMADKTKLMLVVTNLLTNAIRFTPEKGEIHLRAFVKSGEA